MAMLREPRQLVILAPGKGRATETLKGDTQVRRTTAKRLSRLPNPEDRNFSKHTGRWSMSMLTACPDGDPVRSIHLPLAPFPIGCAQFAAQDFAAGVAGERGNHVDRLGHLEPGKSLAGPVNDAVGIDLRAGTRDHAGLD